LGICKVRPQRYPNESPSPLFSENLAYWESSAKANKYDRQQKPGD
jgi:hypothetical protein